MNRTLCAAALFALSFSNLAHAQAARTEDAAVHQAALEAKQKYVVSGTDATVTCSFNFSANSGNKFIKYCVTKNGNITQFESPAGQEYISPSPAGEGYGLCNFDTATQYFDYAGFGDSANWQAPVTLSSSATAVKIERTTNDGIFTLTQTIALNKGTASTTVSMAIKNNTTTSRHIGLLRYADVDAGGFTSNSFDFSNRTAFGYNQMSFGLQLQYVSGAFSNGGFSQVIPGGPNPCQIFTHVAGPLANTDGSVFLQYDMQLGSKATKTVVVSYKSF
ncbi:MAG: hypothetical protein HY010_09715 [Acidobacteria bacterium]|nr:hypothetical protein [Acidobacteriota bacterium]